VSKDWSGSLVWIGLIDFWQNVDEFVAVTKQRSNDAAYLFLLDCTIGSEVDRGAREFVDLLKHFRGRWCGAVLSGILIQETEHTLRREAGQLVGGTAWNEHYCGSGQDWLNDSKALIKGAIDGEVTRVRWPLRLRGSASDCLTAAIHRMQNLRIPITADVETLREIQKSTSLSELDKQSIQGILVDYWLDGEGSYLTIDSRLHRGGNMDLYLDAEYEHLSATLEESERELVATQYQAIIDTLQGARSLTCSLEDCLVDPLHVAEMCCQQLDRISMALMSIIDQLRKMRHGGKEGPNAESSVISAR
jgi:hypothetical protein